MQLDALNLDLRPRGVWEGCDLGVRLLQSSLPSVYGCHLLVALPLFTLCLAAYPLAGWLPVTLIWLSKPWLDRTILFTLSRALFGAATTTADLMAAQREVLWSRIAYTLTLRRLTASRAFTQPVIQLEGLAGPARRSRLNLLAARHRGVARGITLAFAAAELAVMLGLLSLKAWLTPNQGDFNPATWFLNTGLTQGLAPSIAYALAVAFIEPFHVAAGFGMYLNRRVELEAWDIEQAFRRAFPS